MELNPENMPTSYEAVLAETSPSYPELIYVTILLEYMVNTFTPVY